MKTSEQLNKMMRNGQLYEYHGKPISVLNWAERNGSYTMDVILDNKSQKIEKENAIALENFLNQCKEVIEGKAEKQDDPEAVNPDKITLPDKIKRDDYVPVLLKENKETFKNLAQMLFEDVQKVRKDPNYVNQAKQSANTANSIINLVKCQLEILKKG